MPAGGVGRVESVLDCGLRACIASIAASNAVLNSSSERVVTSLAAFISAINVTDASELGWREGLFPMELGCRGGLPVGLGAALLRRLPLGFTPMNGADVCAELELREDSCELLLEEERTISSAILG